MTTDSIRLRIPDKHRHEEDPGLPDADVPPPRATPLPGGEGDKCQTPGTLRRDGDKVVYRAEDGTETAARVLWARPLSGRGGPLSVMAADKKREIAYLPGVDCLCGESRRIALEELAGGMIMARITAVRSVRPRFGNYYWDVETDRGPRRFLLNSPETNTLRPEPDAVVLRDVSGNCYEINPLSGLDGQSLREIDRVL